MTLLYQSHTIQFEILTRQNITILYQFSQFFYFDGDTNFPLTKRTNQSIRSSPPESSVHLLDRRDRPNQRTNVSSGWMRYSERSWSCTHCKQPFGSLAYICRPGTERSSNLVVRSCVAVARFASEFQGFESQFRGFRLVLNFRAQLWRCLTLEEKIARPHQLRRKSSSTQTPASVGFLLKNTIELILVPILNGKRTRKFCF